MELQEVRASSPNKKMLYFLSRIVFKHLWVERGMLSGLTKETCISVIVIKNEPILSSMLPAGRVQDMFSGEAGEGERGRQSGDDWRLLLSPGPEILPVS